jgi:hypothetical protein
MFADARTPGNVKAVTELIRNTSSNNFRMEVVDIIFHHLQQKWILPAEAPPHLDSKDQQIFEQLRIDQARTASYCSSDAMTTALIQAPKHLYGRVVDEIISHLDDFV